jgi:hypothetical protein
MSFLLFQKRSPLVYVICTFLMPDVCAIANEVPDYCCKWNWIFKKIKGALTTTTNTTLLNRWFLVSHFLTDRQRGVDEISEDFFQMKYLISYWERASKRRKTQISPKEFEKKSMRDETWHICWGYHAEQHNIDSPDPYDLRSTPQRP